MNRDYPKNVIAFDLVIALLVFIGCILYAITQHPSEISALVGVP